MTEYLISRVVQGTPPGDLAETLRPFRSSLKDLRFTEGDASAIGACEPTVIQEILAAAPGLKAERLIPYGRGIVPFSEELKRAKAA